MNLSDIVTAAGYLFLAILLVVLGGALYGLLWDYRIRARQSKLASSVREGSAAEGNGYLERFAGEDSSAGFTGRVSPLRERRDLR